MPKYYFIGHLPILSFDLKKNLDLDQNWLVFKDIFSSLETDGVDKQAFIEEMRKKEADLGEHLKSLVAKIENLSRNFAFIVASWYTAVECVIRLLFQEKRRAQSFQTFHTYSCYACYSYLLEISSSRSSSSGCSDHQRGVLPRFSFSLQCVYDIDWFSRAEISCLQWCWKGWASMCHLKS